MLLHDEGEVSLKVGTLHRDLVSTAIFVAGEHVCHEWHGCRFVGALHYAEGELNSASDDRLVGLPQAYKE